MDATRDVYIAEDVLEVLAVRAEEYILNLVEEDASFDRVMWHILRKNKRMLLFKFVNILYINTPQKC